jgi:hypothetical protein
MAFELEDGTGLETSNALASVAFCDTYHADRGNTAWTGVQAVKEAAIIRATDYLCNRFKFLGDKYSEDQALEFPRVYDDPEDPQMPVKMQQAVAEYAVRALSAALAPDPTVDATGGKVTAKREKVGPIEEETHYSETAGISVLKPYPAADMLLRGLVDTARRVIR